MVISMKLDNRLMAIADLVRKDKVFADIGTDHAYLPVYLVEKGIIKKCVYLITQIHNYQVQILVQ